jgi:hypothetical protein
MINSIEQYLSELKKELSGSDRATVQDALSDAEEYLRTAVAGTIESRPGVPVSDALPDIIARYGSPSEVAAAYREIEARTPPAFTHPAYKQAEPVAVSAQAAPDNPTPAASVHAINNRPFLVRFFGIFAEPRAWGSLFYLLFALATGIIYFTWVVTGLSLSFGLMVLIIGLPLFFLFLLSVRGITLVEGRLVEALLGVRMPRRSLFTRKDLGFWQKLKGLLTQRQTWTATVYMALQFPLGIIYFTVIVALVGACVWLIGRPIWELGFGQPAFIITPYEYFTYVWALPFYVIGGVLLLTLTMHLARLTGKMHGLFAKVMLVKE